jgi:hypothetical protein
MTEPARPYRPQVYSAPANLGQRAINAVPYSARSVSVPNGVPRFLGNRPVLFYSWMAALVIVIFDEWHTNHILPRPARLWYTTLVYAILAMVSTFDPVVPITNALGLGYTFTLLYQYYNDSGQFAQPGRTEPTPVTAPDLQAAP